MNDLISRQQAIDALRAMQTYKIFAGDDLLLIDQAGAQTEMMILPSAQPERKKGEWIHQGKFSRVECDQCGKVFRNAFAPKNFCPNCGADLCRDIRRIAQGIERIAGALEKLTKGKDTDSLKELAERLEDDLK